MKIYKWGQTWYVEDGDMRIGRAPTKRWAQRLAAIYQEATAAGYSPGEAYDQFWYEYQAHRQVQAERTTGRALR